METEFEKFSGFQWDEGNSHKNLLKHHVEDWECEQVFFNEPLLVLDDPKYSLVEKRWAAFGRTDRERLLVVIFTRKDKLLRVISAREMKRKEKTSYEENT